MKGLLRKDWYLMIRYCRPLLLVGAVFLAASLFQPGNVVFWAYPCLFAATIPYTLCAYDEREKWTVYSGTLPVSRGLFVSVKYLMGLFSVAGVLAVTAAVHTVAGIVAPGKSEDLSMLVSAAGLAFLAPAVVLPLMFRFGAEKARIFYFILLLAVCCLSFVFLDNDGAPGAVGAAPAAPGLLCAAGLVLYGISWGLSVAICRKREL